MHGLAAQAPAQQAELVALRIGQDVPGFLARLTHVGGLGADSQQTLKLFILISIGGVHVDMQRQLASLRLVGQIEDDRRLESAKPSSSGPISTLFSTRSRTT